MSLRTASPMSKSGGRRQHRRNNSGSAGSIDFIRRSFSRYASSNCSSGGSGSGNACHSSREAHSCAGRRSSPSSSDRITAVDVQLQQHHSLGRASAAGVPGTVPSRAKCMLSLGECGRSQSHEGASNRVNNNGSNKCVVDLHHREGGVPRRNSLHSRGGVGPQHITEIMQEVVKRCCISRSKLIYHTYIHLIGQSTVWRQV